MARAALPAHALAVQRGADHARVVEDERVAGAEQVGEVADDAVFELAGSPLPHSSVGRGLG